MTLAIVPLRPGASSKSRLAGALGLDARAELVAGLARHVVGELRRVDGLDGVRVITTDVEMAASMLGAGVGVDIVGQDPRAPGLDAAIAQARRGATSVLVVHADLPDVGVEDIAALLAAPSDVVIAPDHLGTGTNALVLRGRAAAMPTRFGPGSFRAHVAEARALGVEPSTVRRPGLARDLDTPDDLCGRPSDGMVCGWAHGAAT